MKEFDRIKDMVYDELDQLTRHDQLTKDAVCMIGELVDILKDIGTVEMFEEGVYVDDNGMYHDGSGYSQGYAPRRYEGGNSYRGYNVGGRNMMNNSGYSRRGRSGYSREDGKDHLVQKLEALMNEVNDEHDRQSIQRLIDQM